MVFELFLLVPDVDLAAQALIRAGYEKKELCLDYSRIPQFDNLFAPARTETQNPATDIASFDPANNSVILLPTQNWFYNLPARPEDIVDWFPTLPQLLTSLIAKWLDLGKQDWALRLHVAVHIGYIYGYIGAVKKPGFEQQLPQKYLQFHLDQVKGIRTADLGAFRCQEYYSHMIRCMENGEEVL